MQRPTKFMAIRRTFQKKTPHIMLKKYSFVLGLALLNLNLNAQSLSKANFSLAQKLNGEFPTNRQLALFAQGDVAVIKKYAEQHGGSFKYAAGDIAAILLPLGAVQGLADLEKVSAIEDNYMKIEPMNDSMRVKNNINPVQMGMAPLPQGYDGTGVIMGIIDSGIDFTHPDFKDANGNTRVLYIWDHNLTGGVAPPPFNYGREFNSSDINGGLATAHVDNSNGHGTHVTGVAAGNGFAMNAHKGVAPGAQIISVCVNWNLPDNNWLTSIADAVNYIYTKATSMNKPCVINISAGTYYGSHDGKDLQAQAISNLISQHNGRSLVCAAGNAGSIPIHVQHEHTIASDTSFTWFNYNASYGSSIYMEMWATQTNFTQMKFAVGADKTSPNYELQTMGSFYTVSQNLGTLRTDTLFGVSGNRIARVQRFASLSNGRYSMIFNILPDSTQYSYRLATTNVGKMDLWSFQMTTAANIPSVQQFPEIVNYAAPDLNQTIVSSFTCSDKVISVGEHKNRMSYQDCSNNLFTSTTNYTPGSLAPQSSHGPTRDGRLKPEICASGGMTLSAGAYNILPNLPLTSKALGCLHFRDGGTSTASPVVAGIAALILQRYPTATWQDIKTCITQNAAVDPLVTGTLPNNSWGYGKADGFAAMLGCSFLSALYQQSNALTATVTPNPFADEITIQLTDAIGGILRHGEITVFDVFGKKILSQPMSPNKIQTSSLAKGVYFVNITSGSFKTVSKVVKM